MPLTHLNPAGLHTSPAFSQGIITEAGRTVYVGGQNGTDAHGTITGGVFEQTAQALRNVLAVLDAAGATPEHVAKLTIYLHADADVNAGFAASQEVWGQHPTAITVLRVAGFALPDALVEIDAIATLP
ncbi:MULTISPECIES: RidA family protein [Actinoalloteichus]|uniref:Translation initiation inhibitor, yjgF family n=1 Tax=Actinoalloteichus fjordicus TaxID=1612552 RepID=A0AAC9L9Z3_9PSEU|nr:MULTISPECIES: RidA family protein [Actinoalloteichus]APU12752.1 putative translation initiation inhibitor, yjgF family [Actinoalloteichus fjordicus]APU18723.1 putative translation initiation inhibitor, yjgF family [Actinoalloteichus sp. GBA129-24]